jgi:type II secretory pathway component GspD/PulD (secretin)
VQAQESKNGGLEKPLPEKRVGFAMRDMPWNKVMAWLADETGFPVVVSSNYPTGTFNFIPPKGRLYTIPEVIDVINGGLLSKKYILIRRPQAFTLVAADEKIDDVPMIDLEKLKDHGKTELVRTSYRVKNLIVEDIANQVRRMLGPFGEVHPLPGANLLTMQDTVGNLQTTIQILKALDNPKEGEERATTYIHPCKYMRARDAESRLREILGDPRKLIEVTQPPPGTGTPGGNPKLEKKLERLGEGHQPQPNIKIRMHYISSYEPTNTVMVSGPPDKISLAKAVMEALDVPGPGSLGELPKGPYIMQTYPVPDGNAENVAKALANAYKGVGNIAIQNISTTSIMVWAPPADQFDIAKHIKTTDPRPSTALRIPLNTADAKSTALWLQGMLGDTKGGAPFIEADPLSNAIIIRGSPEQVKEVQYIIRSISEAGPGVGGSGTMRVIGLEQANGATVAEALQLMLKKMRNNNVEIIVPGSEMDVLKPKSKESSKKMPRIEDETSEEQDKPHLGPPADAQDDDDTTPLQRPPAKVKEITEVPDVQIKKPGDGKLPGRRENTITITATGNRLIISSQDTDALNLVQELVRLITAKSKLGEGDFEVIHLKYANAVETAKLLDTAFNEKGGQQGQPGAPAFPFGFGQGGGPPGGGPGKQGAPGGPGGGGPGAAFRAAGAAAAGGGKGGDRIRVVADGATNSLLIRANPLDMLTIRNLIRKAIDVPDTDSDAVQRTWIIGPLKNTTASEVAQVLEGAYKDSMASTVQGVVGGFPGFSFFGFQGQQQLARQGGFAGQDPSKMKAPKLALGVNDRTNTLVAVCSASMYKDVKALVDYLDEAAGAAPRQIVVKAVPGVDPQLIEMVVQAIQGPQASQQRRPGTQGPFGGGQAGTMPGGLRQIGPGTAVGTVPGGAFRQGGGGQGIGGGGRPGGGGPGGGGPGGGGGRPFGGGQSRGPDAPLRGPDFFAQSVKDDRRASHVLFDPQSYLDADEPAEAFPRALAELSRGIRQASYHEEQQAKEAAPAVKEDGGIRAPRLPVQIEAIPGLDLVIVSGQNPEDVAAILEVIRYIQLLAKGSEPEVRLVPLEHGDATGITNNLNLLFTRFILSQGYNALVPGGAAAQPARPAQQAPGAPGAQAAPAAPATAVASSGSSAVFLLAITRLNSILVAAPASRMRDVLKEIARLDIPNSPQSGAVPFQLKHAAASRIAPLLSNFYQARYYPEPNQVHITWDDTNNTVWVQASPNDMAEIRSLLEHMDTVRPPSSELRIVHLNNAVSDSLEQILTQAIALGFTPLTATVNQPQAVRPAQLLAPGGAGTSQINPVSKATALKFYYGAKGDKVVESDLLEDVRITSDPRTNSLVIMAQEKTMRLILELVHDLDQPAAAVSNIHVINLKKIDATTVASMLQTIFLGTSTTTPTAGRPGGALAQAALQATQQPLTITIQGFAPEGAAIIPIRVTVEPITNSLVIAGSRNDLDVIEAVVYRLDDADVPQRQFQVISLKNALAPDVVNAINTFLTQENTFKTGAGSPFFTGFAQLDQEVTITPEPITNKIILSATPKYMEKILRMIAEFDILPPQVVVQCLIAEVDLNGTEEFGVELGLQSPVLFSRSVLPAGTTGNTTTFDAAVPGFNFNNVTLPLGQATLASPQVVGVQGITNYGVGRAAANGIGGFVFSAASQSVNILIRALATQGRVDILSRPQLMTADNQQASLVIGQSFPYVTGITTVTTTVAPTTVSTVNYRDVGVLLQITPKINPDGSVVMRVVPEVATPVLNSGVFITPGVQAVAFNTQTVETTVIAQDGETVVIGGLITKTDTKTENKVPYLGDLPLIGGLWRFRNETKAKVELLVILTPHIVRSRAEGDRILAEESRRMDWILGDVLKTHGTYGMEPIMPMPAKQPPFIPDPALAPNGSPPVIISPAPVSPVGPSVPVIPEELPSPQPLAPGARVIVPGATDGGPVLAPAGAVTPASLKVPAGVAPVQASPVKPVNSPAQDAAGTVQAGPKERESRRWFVFPWLRKGNE